MKKYGFTLAEVLITLGVIGVVAAMTLPTLIQNYQDKGTVAKLEKTYSIISQAYWRSVADNGELREWGVNKSDEDTDRQVLITKVAEKFKPYLKIIKDCAFDAGCFYYDGKYKYLRGQDYFTFGGANPARYMVILSDGVSIAFLPNWDTDGTLNLISVYCDVNGEKAPNTAGKDLFQFFIKDNKIEPVSITDMNSSVELTMQSGGMGFQCYSNGLTCTDWVMMYHNLDYLHCNDLEYGVKTKCK